MHKVSMKDWLVYGVFAPIPNKKLRLGLSLAALATGLTLCVLSERRERVTIKPRVDVSAL